MERNKIHSGIPTSMVRITSIKLALTFKALGCQSVHHKLTYAELPWEL